VLLQVPLLKGLSDNDLLRVAGRMPERMYADGDALIRYGERGDEMYLIRYGKVGAMVACGAMWRDIVKG
jgi:cGMP-dependent protein kinase